MATPKTPSSKSDIEKLGKSESRQFDTSDNQTRKRLLRVLRHVEDKIIAYAKELENMALDPDVTQRETIAKARAAKQAIAIRDQIAAAFEDYYKEAASIVADYDTWADEIVRSFRRVGVPAEFSTVDQNVIAALQQTSLQEYDQLGRIFQNRLSDELYRSVLTNRNFGAMTKSIRAALTGHTDVRGRPMSAHAKQISHDEFMKFHRSFQASKAEDVGIRYYLYVGSLIMDSRPFCAARAGKVFHIDEIKSWERQDWKGKNPNQPVMVVLGGYNCRHHLQPVPDFLAEKIYGITLPPTK